MGRWKSRSYTPRTVLVCEHCTTTFTRTPSEVAKSKNNRYFCSKTCHAKAVKTDKTLNGRYAGGKCLPCEQCGNEVYRTPWHLNTNKQNFCSKQCAWSWTSVNRVGEKAVAFRNASKKLLCGQCGIAFETFDNFRVNCSRKCSAKAKLKKKVKLSCSYCNEDYLVHPSTAFWNEQRGRTGAFCSRRCNTLARTGPLSPLWIEDRSLIKNQAHSLRWSADMKTWRKLVYEADNYICQICWNRSCSGNRVVLNAHHIRRFADHLDLRHAVSNGVTLCEPCHKQTLKREKKYEHWFDEIVMFRERVEILGETTNSA